jgi:lipoyl synthase
VFRSRWLGRVPYREALDLQQAIFHHGRPDRDGGNHLLLLEHPHVFTYGPSADLSTNLRVEPGSVGAELVGVQRGGDITYHGPGQLVGYPLLTLPPKNGRIHGLSDTVGYVRSVEQLVIDTLAELGVSAGRLREYPGVWVDAAGENPRKICAIGVRLSRNRTMHGFALNITTDMRYLREYIVPCGIADRPVTSLAEEGINVPMRDVVAIVSRLAAQRWGSGSSHDRNTHDRNTHDRNTHDHAEVEWKERPDDLSLFSQGFGPGERAVARLGRAGVTEGLSISSRKPDWMRVAVNHTPTVLSLKKTVRDLGLVTVCEEAGCPNLSECWNDGTATLMVLGERCTRACGFCLVDTSKPLPPADDEPARVAEAVARMKLRHAVITMVARDDLADGGAAHVGRVIEAIRERSDGCVVEVLISDLHGSADALDVVIKARPDIMNHNVESVARLQRAVRPSAGYARSLALLARSKSAGLTTKSGLIVGLGETDDEVFGVLADLAAVGTDIVTIGQYLRPTTHHLPVARWVEPETFDAFKRVGEQMGIGHVESSPLTRSSYHARAAGEAIAKI